VLAHWRYWKDLTAEREAIAIQNQTQGDQRTITAFFFGTTELGFGVLGALAFKVGVVKSYKTMLRFKSNKVCS